MAMYKYNGVPMPEYPSTWNQSTHPFACIVRLLTNAAFSYRMLCMSEPFYITEYNGVRVIAFPPAANHSFYYADGNDFWHDVGSDDGFAAGEDFGYFLPDETEWVWCNISIYDGDVNVVYPGSTPVLIEEEPEPEPEPEPEEPEKFDLQSFLTGLAMALVSRGQFPKPTAEPVAFLYNGVRLPGLPVVEGMDKAFITTWHQSAGSIRTDLYLFPDNAYYTVTDGGMLNFGGGGAEPVLVMHYKLSENAWAFINNRENATVPPPGGWSISGSSVVYLTWANFDMEYDGTLYMKASDPVPVYE